MPEKTEITAAELRDEKLTFLQQKLSELIYYQGKSNLSSSLPGVTVGSTNEANKRRLLLEVNILLKELGTLEVK